MHHMSLHFTPSLTSALIHTTHIGGHTQQRTRIYHAGVWRMLPEDASGISRRAGANALRASSQTNRRPLNRVIGRCGRVVVRRPGRRTWLVLPVRRDSLLLLAAGRAARSAAASSLRRRAAAEAASPRATLEPSTRRWPRRRRHSVVRASLLESSSSFLYAFSHFVYEGD